MKSKTKNILLLFIRYRLKIRSYEIFFLTNFRKIHFLFLLIFFSYIFPALSEPGVSIFMYHRFGEDKYPSTNVTEKQFLSHINYVLDNKIKILELEEIIMTLNENKICEKQ